MSAGLAIETSSSIAAIPENAYRDLVCSCAAPAYYDPRFLRAAEQHPLMPVEAFHYFTIRQGSHLVGFLPVYQQNVGSADPFGLLQRGTSDGFLPGETALFSHVMHCSDTRILVREPCRELYRLLIEKLITKTGNSRTPQFAILNVSDPLLLTTAREMGAEVRPAVDRFQLNLNNVRSLDELLEHHMPQRGRSEMRRQRRKQKELDVRVRIEAPPFNTPEEIGQLCHETTARRGTPHYLPPLALTRFVVGCGNLIRLVSVYAEGHRIGVGILLVEREVLHFWLAGMKYEIETLSPYTLTLDAIFRHAFEHGYQRIECGRLNERIKNRFGFSPKPLYSITYRSS